MPLMIGQKLYGYCGGYFERETYGIKRIEAVGVDWVMVRESTGEPNFARDEDDVDVHEVLSAYTEPEEDIEY